MRQLRFVQTILFVGFIGCHLGHDPDLMQPDGHGGGYNLTQFGCLLNGPWTVNDDGYNTKICLNDSEVLSRGNKYSEFQKKLVFQLFKDGKIKYWIRLNKSANTQSLSKDHTLGKWTYAPSDSMVYIYFQDFNYHLNFNYVSLGSSYASFQNSRKFDSIYNRKKTEFTEINTFYYTHLGFTLY